MRPVLLGRIAAEAEGVRLRGLMRRVVIRALLAVIALLFALGAIIFAHIALWYWLRTAQGQTYPMAAGILGGADLLAAAVFACLAMRSAPSRTELEALDVRRKAIEAIGETLNWTRLIGSILRILASRRRSQRD